MFGKNRGITGIFTSEEAEQLAKLPKPCKHCALI